jgi:predicted RNA methylase
MRVQTLQGDAPYAKKEQPMAISIGTSNFVSKATADRYYREMGYSDASKAIADGAIQIGAPRVSEGQTLSVIPGEGRYQITEATQSVAVSPIRLVDEIRLLVVEADKVLLPKTHLSQYAEIKRMLETSGGRYNAKGFFTFPVGIDAVEVLASLITGAPLNGKKQSQSFFTPQDLGYRVCNAAGPLDGKRVLEPSAGDGVLADIAEAAGAEVVLVENYPPNIAVLEGKGYDVISKDFLTVTPEEIGLFDAVCANPPFTKNQDIDHILHMWTFLKPGGLLSAIASQSWLKGSQKKQRLFREFLDSHQAEIVEIEAGAFKESGTTVGTVHLRLQKPEHAISVARTRCTSSEVTQSQSCLF